MNLDSISCDLFVDISGSDSSLPSSKLNDALQVLLPGQTLLAVSRKQALQSDISAFCRQHNLQLADQGEVEGQLYFLIRLLQ
jgi:TusA-related sulfurtransferase